MPETIKDHKNIEVQEEWLKSLKKTARLGGTGFILAAGVAGMSYATGWGMGIVDLDLTKKPGGEYKGMSCERINVNAKVPSFLFGTVVTNFEAIDRNVRIIGTDEYWTIFSNTSEEGDSNEGNMLINPLPGIGTSVNVEVRAKTRIFGKEVTIARETGTIESICTPVNKDF